MLRSHPGATILHNLICSRVVPEVIRENGGVPVRTKVGHSFIKEIMAETGAVFGGEHSAHYYFRDNFGADSGLIASVLVLDEISRADTVLSVVRKPFERYSSSGEINTQVGDPDAVMARVAEEFSRSAAGPSRRPHRRLRLVVVQPAAVQHRAAAAPEPRGGDPRRLRPARRRGAGPHYERVTDMTGFDGARPPTAGCSRLPAGQGSAYYLGDGDGLYNPRLHRRYVVRDGIPVMLIDEAVAVDDAEHEAIMARVEQRRPGPDVCRMTSMFGDRIPIWRHCGIRSHDEVKASHHAVDCRGRDSASAPDSSRSPGSPVQAAPPRARLCGGGEFHPLTPARIFDSRPATSHQRVAPPGAKPMGAPEPATFDIELLGLGGIPADAANVLAVVVNITVTEPGANGYLEAYGKGASPAAAPRSSTSRPTRPCPTWPSCGRVPTGR